MFDKRSPPLDGQHPHARPRLSPKSTNEPMDSYFLPPQTPAFEHGPPLWSPFLPADGSHSPVHNENAHIAARMGASNASFGRSSLNHDGIGATLKTVFMSAEGSTAKPAAISGVSEGWNAVSHSPSFALSPSSTLNAKFNHLMRAPQTSLPAATLHKAPSSSPFLPASTSSPAPSTSATPGPPPHASSDFPSSATLSGPPSSSSTIKLTPGPGMTAGLSLAGPSSSGSFKLPPTLPVAGRKLAGRHAARPSASTSGSTSNARFTLFSPQTLLSDLLSAKSSPSSPSPPILILDIRPHTAYLQERLSSSINICVPSTLLRRPAFGTDRVQEGLPANEQEVFSRWASCSAIVVLDPESTVLAEGGGISSLLAKFDKAGYKEKLGWVKGGWAAVKNQLVSLPSADADRLLEVGMTQGSASAPVSGRGTPLGGAAPDSSTTHSSSLPLPSSSDNPSTPSKKHGRPVLQVRDLPIAAFQMSSTSAFVNSGGNGSAGQGPLPTTMRGVDMTLTSPSTSGGSSTSLASQRPGMGKRRKSGNESLSATYTAAGQREEGDGNSTLPQPGSLGMQGGFSVGMHPPVSEKNKSQGEGQLRMSANPFFENIRQNSEALSLDRSLANLTPVTLPSVPPALLPRLPAFLRSLICLSPMDRSDRLARQYYELEAAERERLEGTFRWHSEQTAVESTSSGKDGAADSKGGEADVAARKKRQEEKEKWEKFGIFAGVELGNLNRFKNIFPYEHARVKLRQPTPSSTDYVNASHLFLRGSSKRFIASQGPLPTTYRDFWQMCDQEHVGVIIMLTNLQEGGRDKCGRYWVQQDDADWEVKVDGDLAHEEEERANVRSNTAGGGFFGGGDGGPPAEAGGFFAAFDAARVSPETEKAPQTQADQTIRRTLAVRRLRGPDSSSFGSDGDEVASSSRPRKIRHIQYRAWPDFDIPADPADVVALVHEVEAAQRNYMREIGWKIEEHDGLEPPILAHCSAGVGRTGVFIMVMSLLEKLRNDRAAERKAARREQKDDDKMDIDYVSASAPSRPPLAERLSDPETSFLSAGLSLSSLDSPVPQFSSNTTPVPSSPTRADSASSSIPPLSTETPALNQSDPAFAGVNELREMRMSMVANYRQYVCIMECLIEGAVKEMQDEAARDV
ncbi:hypothetical protein JCM11641_008158 [Rhodosporidiobolus odoratus]